MFRPEHDTDIQVLARPFHRRDQLHAPGARWEGEGHSPLSGRTSFTVVTSGLSKVALSFAVLALVGTGCFFAIQKLDLTAQADTAPAVASQKSMTTGVPDQTAEITALRSEVMLLTEQSMEMRAELALLTGQGGVLPQLITRLQEQRRINGAHEGALRDLYSTTGLTGAALPSGENGAADPELIGTRPVQVTPVAAAQDEAPKRVVLIPQDGDEDASGAAKDGE